MMFFLHPARVLSRREPSHRVLSAHKPSIRLLLIGVLLLASGCAHQAAISPNAAPDAGTRVSGVSAADEATPETADAKQAEDATRAASEATSTADTDHAPASPAEPLAQDRLETTAPALTASPTAPTQDGLDDAVTDTGDYNPVADSTLPPPAVMPASYDPWERFNRRMHHINEVLDRRVAKPLATTYVRAMPRPVRLGVGNFFNNLGQPVSALNALLQGKPKQAGQSVGRFLMNSTLGIGGLFDPASAAKIPDRNEDFGQTLGVWGWKRSRYIELPLFGPRTVRDLFGMAGDAPLSPIRPIQDDKLRVFLQGLQMVDVRTQLLSVDRMREGASDDYALVRDAWMQRRQYQIFGDREQDSGGLPDYLQEDDNPTVPADAMPVLEGTP